MINPLVIDVVATVRYNKNKNDWKGCKYEDNTMNKYDPH